MTFFWLQVARASNSSLVSGMVLFDLFGRVPFSNSENAIGIKKAADKSTF